MVTENASTGNLEAPDGVTSYTDDTGTYLSRAGDNNPGSRAGETCGTREVPGETPVDSDERWF